MPVNRLKKQSELLEIIESFHRHRSRLTRGVSHFVVHRFHTTCHSTVADANVRHERYVASFRFRLYSSSDFSLKSIFKIIWNDQECDGFVQPPLPSHKTTKNSRPPPSTPNRPIRSQAPSNSQLASFFFLLVRWIFNVESTADAVRRGPNFRLSLGAVWINLDLYSGVYRYKMSIGYQDSYIIYEVIWQVLACS